MKSLDEEISLWSKQLVPKAGDFPLGSSESRAAARAMLSKRPLIRSLRIGNLPVPFELLPSYEQLMRDWKDEGDCYIWEEIRGDVIIEHEVYKDSDAFRRIMKGREE